MKEVKPALWPPISARGAGGECCSSTTSGKRAVMGKSRSNAQRRWTSPAPPARSLKDAGINARAGRAATSGRGRPRDHEARIRRWCRAHGHGESRELRLAGLVGSVAHNFVHLSSVPVQIARRVSPWAWSPPLPPQPSC